MKDGFIACLSSRVDKIQVKYTMTEYKEQPHQFVQIFYLFYIKKNLLFLFYTSTFTKHSHQFIYFTHLFNKIFILFYIFYYFLPSGTNSQTRLLCQATPTPTPSQPPFNKIRQATPTPILQQNHPHPASYRLFCRATNPT